MTGGWEMTYDKTESIDFEEIIENEANECEPDGIRGPCGAGGERPL